MKHKKLLQKLLPALAIALPATLSATTPTVARLNADTTVKDQRPPALPQAAALQQSFRPRIALAADIAAAESGNLAQANVSLAANAPATLTYVKPDKRTLRPVGNASAATSQAPVIRTQRMATPAKIITGYVIGKDFVHNGSESNCIMQYVADATDPTMIHIHNFYGLEETVDAVIDVNTGTVSILPQRIWQSTQYGDVYMFPITISDAGIQYFPSSPVRGTIDSKGVIRLPQWGAIVGDGDNKGLLLAAIDSSEYHPSNATMTATKRANGQDSEISYPLLIEQPQAAEMKIYNFGTTSVPVTARISADGTASVSEQYIANMGLYGDFHTFPIDPATGVITKDEPVMATISKADSTMTFSPWVAGSIMQYGLVALYLPASKFKASIALQLPAANPFNLEGNGTQASPYLIKTTADLVALSEASQKNSFPNRYFKLMNDLDMSSVGTFLPIGSKKAAFNGVFDGNGHTIANLKVNALGYHFQGLFGAIYTNARISNLTVTNGSITGSGYYLGLIAGYSMGVIDNCHATGTVTSTGLCAGGITGRTYGTVNNCSFSGRAQAAGYIGGIAGYSYGALTGCHSDADVSLPARLTNGASCVGGIAGLAQSYSTNREGRIADCRFSGTVTQGSGYGFAGGIAGYLYAVDMDGCLNTGLVRTTSTTGTEEAAGGICGIVRDSYIDDCHNAGLIQADGLSTYAGGLIGYLTCSYNSIDGMTEPIFVKNCYNAGQVQGRERTIHAGVFGDEFTMEQFEEKPSDTAFTNVYSDNQATGLKDTRFGQNTDFFLGKLPQGFSSSVWDTNTGAYPTLKAFAALTDNDVAKSAAVFAAGESTRVMKHNAMLQAAQGIAWQLLDAKGNLTAATQGLSISGNSLAVGSAYANDTLVATINGKATGRRLIINVVPKLFDGEGTAASPYLIKNKADFMILHTAVMHYDHEGDFFRQTADVDFGLADDFAGVGAGNHLLEFAGVFDGDNHLIKNLKITAAKVNAQGNLLQGTYNYGGLFHIGSPTSIIRNVIIDASCQLDFYGSAGAVIGYTTGKVENCRNYAAIRTGYNRIGGIAGHVDEGGSIAGCYNGASVTASNDYVGGIAGQNMGSISDSQNDGDITGAGKYTGGIAGASAGSLTVCVNSGTISGAEYTGGVIGSNAAVNGMGNVQQCVSSGLVVTSGTPFGGVIGYSNGRGNIEANYFDASVNNMDGCSSLSQGFNGVSTSELVTATVPEGLDKEKFQFSATAYPTLKAFANETAGIAQRSIYVLFGKGEKRTNVIHATPLAATQALQWQLKGDSVFSIAGGNLKVNMGNQNIATDTLTAKLNGFTKTYPLTAIKAILAGNGSESSPFRITSAADLTLLSEFMTESGMDYEGYFFRVENDITYADTTTFKPIGFTGPQFQGAFNGNGKTISGFSLTDETSKTGKYLGFFGTIGSKGSVSNLTLDGTLKCYSYTGGFAGKLYGSIVNSVSRMKVDSKGGYGAGFAGYMYDGSLIRNCVFEGVISPSYATNYNYIGGIAGQTDAGSLIDSCINRGTVGQNKNTTGTTWTGQQYVGGIAAWHSGTASHCRNEGSVVARQQAGGIAGRLGKTGQILDCENVADITLPNGGNLGGMAPSTQGSGLSYILRCKNSGNLRGKSYTAGIIGQITAGCTVDSCFNTGKITGFSSTAFSVGGVIGQMASQSKYPSSASHSGNYGDVYNESQSTGGFAGKITGGHVSDCFNTGNVKVVKEKDDATSSGVGGFAGSFCSTAERIWNSGNVESNVPGAAGIFGVGAMPIAKVSHAVNYGNVTLSRTLPAKGLGAAGIWGGYGPVELTDCYNHGTVTAPNDAAGINAAMHSNGNGGTTILRCYNTGAVIVPDTATRVSNVALISSYVDTRTPIDPALMHVDSTYYNRTALGSFANDTLAVGLSNLQLQTAALGNAYTYRRACFPVLAFVDSLPLSDFHAVDIDYADNDSAQSITNGFHVGMRPNVVWSTSDGLRIDEGGHVYLLKEGTHTLTATVLNTKEPLSKQYTVNVITLGVSDLDNDGKEIATTEYYSLSGIRLQSPIPGTPCIARIRYTDGTTATRKILITARQ